MKIILLLAGFLIIFLDSMAVANSIQRPGFTASKLQAERPALDQSENFGRHFQAVGVKGSILIYDRNNRRFFEYNPRRNDTPFPPASTFKIPNSLIALETGAIADDLALLTWDGISRTLPGWNRDLNLRESFKIMVWVWG